MAADPPRERKGKWAEYSSLGLMFPASIVVGFAFGHFLDKWLKTDPWLTMLFILFGILAGFVNLFAQTRRHEPRP